MNTQNTKKTSRENDILTMHPLLRSYNLCLTFWISHTIITFIIHLHQVEYKTSANWVQIFNNYSPKWLKVVDILTLPFCDSVNISHFHWYKGVYIPHRYKKISLFLSKKWLETKLLMHVLSHWVAIHFQTSQSVNVK